MTLHEPEPPYGHRCTIVSAMDWAGDQFSVQCECGESFPLGLAPTPFEAFKAAMEHFYAVIGPVTGPDPARHRR